MIFFFQAEDGIRDRNVTGVQTCALPISDTATLLPSMQETGAQVIGVDWRIPLDRGWKSLDYKGAIQGNLDPVLLFANQKELYARSEERRVGKEGRYRWGR